MTLSQQDLQKIRDGIEQTLADYYRKKQSIFYNVETGTLEIVHK